MNDLRSARYVSGLRLEFDDGLEGDVDLSSYLGKGLFSHLWPNYRTSSNLPWRGTLAWPNGADIAPERLYEMTENASRAVERTR